MIIGAIIFLLVESINSLGNVTTTRVIIEGETYSKTDVILQAERFSDNFIVSDGMFLPSDLITLLPTNAEFFLQITQGRITDTPQTNLYPLSLQRYFHRGLVIDYPSGYFYHSKTFSPFDDVEKFKDYFDVFAFTFKITLNPILDRANYIILGEDKFLIELKEKVCSEHLDGIKETLPPHKRQLFEEYVNYDHFTKSDYKSIKYFIRVTPGYVEYAFEILYKPELAPTYRIDKDLKDKDIEKFPLMDTIRSKRYLSGIHFNLDNLVFHHLIEFDKKTSKKISNNEERFIIIEQIPVGMLTPLYSSLTVTLYDDRSNLMDTIQIEELAKYFNISLYDKTEIQYPEIPFTYESKKNAQMNIVYRGGLKPFSKMEITFELRKTLINFESMDNDEEFGISFPCGLIILGRNYTISNNIYFNMPNIDITMPFNYISVTWVVFGFMLVQILNIYLGKASGGIFQTLKERFLAKWGFLFGN